MGQCLLVLPTCFITYSKIDVKISDLEFLKLLSSYTFDPDPFMAELNVQGLPWQETFDPVKVD